MEIFIQHQGQQTGPFSMQQIQAGLANGTYQPSDLIWYQGIDGWIPVSNALQNLSNTASSSIGAPAGSSGLALTSMILGISSFLCGVTAIPAVICGHIALVKIKRSQGQLAGNGFAITGLITGYLGVFVFIAMMAALTAPMIIRQKKRADQTQAIMNARQISFALMEFKSDYYSFPNATTAPIVADAFGAPAISGSSSNARFRQLFQTEITQSEEIFYAKSAGTRKPDGVIIGNKALAPGECGFGYIENVRTDDGAARPFVITPFKHGSDEFDPMPFDGKAVALFTDGSVQVLPIDRNTGEAMLDGQNLFDPTHPIWGGIPPSLLLPE
jgi:type II secretory pathway pseudopilin PulG